MKLQLQQAETKLKETTKQLSLVLGQLRSVANMLRGTSHSPDLKRIETYLSKAQEMLITTSKELHTEIVQLPDVPDANSPNNSSATLLPRWAVVVIGIFCGSGVFALIIAGFSLLTPLAKLLSPSMPWWFLLIILLEAGASLVAGYISGRLSDSAAKANATAVGGALAGLAWFIFGYKSHWDSLYLLTPFIASFIGSLLLEDVSLSSPPQEQKPSEPQKPQQELQEQAPTG